MSWNSGGGGGGWNKGPKLPTWYPSAQPQTITMENPPSYGQPPKAGAKGPFWGSTVNIGGTSYKWWISPNEMNALQAAGNPQAGASITVTRTGQTTYEVKQAGGGRDPAYAAQEQHIKQFQQQQYGQQSANDGGYSPSKAVLTHAWFLRQIIIAGKAVGIEIPIEQATTMSTGQFIEWNRCGRPPLAAAQQPPADEPAIADRDDDDQPPF